LSQLGGRLYENVGAVLSRLGEKFRLFIVSNCQCGYIETFLKITGFAPHFDDFECWGNTGETKSMNLRNLIRRNDLRYPILVGDGEGDQIAAKDCGIPFIFAAYGFGDCSDYAFKAEAFDDIEHYISWEHG
jgi:phosphoglycolate phosphatase